MTKARSYHLMCLAGPVLMLAAPVLFAQEPACDLLGADCARIRQAVAAGRLADAAAVAEHALNAVEASGNADSLVTAQAIDAVVALRCDLGQGREAETVAFAERAVAIRTRDQGETHSDLVESLHNLARVLRQAGDFKRAVALTEQALDIAGTDREARLPLAVHCLSELSAAQIAAGEWAAGEATGKRALDLAETIRPEAPLLVAEALNGVAVARFYQRDAAGATPLFRRALALREGRLGPDHLLLARTVMNLGMALRATGERDEGEAMLRRALAIYERVAPGHSDAPICLNSLALIARSRGEFSEARRLWERALEAGARAFGEEHPTVAGVLNNLANLRRDMGDFPAAEALLARSLAIRERVRGPEHLDVAQALVNLETIQAAGGRCAEARASAERALAIREKAAGPDSALVGQSLIFVGEAQECAGDLEGSRVAYERAVAVLERAEGTTSAFMFTAQHFLATALHSQGDLTAAADAYRRCLDLSGQVWGPDHPRVGEVLSHHGLLLAQRGDLPGAMQTALRAERIGREHLRLTCRSLSEREALAYAGSRPRGLDLALSLVAAGAGSAADLEGVLEALVRSRTVVLDEIIARGRPLAGGGAETAMFQKRVAETANELVALLVRGPGREGPDQYRQGLAAARERLDEAERAAVSHDPSRAERGPAPTLSQVRDALPDRSALVAFARYSHQPVKGDKGTAGVPSYLAFVLTTGREPAVVPLGPAAAIEDVVRAWEAEVARGPGRDRARAAAAEEAYRIAGERLRAAIWDPVDARLGDARTAFVVPDGVLHLVHLDALPRAGGGYLIEAPPAIHQLTAEKDLLVPPQGMTRGQGLLAMGGAAFDLAPGAKDSAPASGSEVRAAQDSPACPEFQRIRFAPLSQTDGEAREVARTFQRAQTGTPSRGATTVLRGAQATESAFRRLAPGKRILHLATHGFFLGEGCRAEEPAGRGIGGLVSTAETTPPPRPSDATLRLAGLALAGANRRGAAPSPADDGILTAEEIALLDLDGVEWAVLSACESGAGTVATGEGVLGLRRAFLIAGARSVIMSLWAVDDAAARAWMNVLYRARLERRLSTAGAVREAGLEVLQTRRLQGLSTHPFYWGGFVSTGDWR
ncbi:MAG: CHAT domain-containing protein [Thermoanaerobaculaceae bacterium]